MDLKEIIIKKIKEKGPVPFRDFMEMALYFPNLGYYIKEGRTIGKRGDFFTSPFISSAFGAMIGRQLEEIWQQMGGEFTIVEFGGGTGLLCYDILKHLKNNPVFYDCIQYIIIEQSPVLRRLSQKYLPEKVIFLDDTEKLGSFQGCILSNELFDNFPVHKITMEGGRLMEIFVDYRHGFREILKPPGNLIMDSIESMQIQIPEGCQTEICLDALSWYGKISHCLKKGYIITIDYGYLVEELFHRIKNQETIRCYYQHQMNRDPYARIGEQDITADVNFSALSYWGALHGFEFSGYVNQGGFLRALGLIPYLMDMEDSEENKRFAFNTLLNQMGAKFKVLFQRKAIAYTHLQGLSFEKPTEKITFSPVSALS
jgi:SAM-dependent MidA family methyltransferase